jgi:histidinol-phosphate aminotransferase
MHNNVAQLSGELKALSEQLQKIPDITLVGNQCGNFVLFSSPYNKKLMQYLVANNVLIRDQSKQILLDGCLRISIGTQAQNAQLLTLIHTFFDQQTVNTTNQEAAL